MKKLIVLSTLSLLITLLPGCFNSFKLNKPINNPENSGTIEAYESTSNYQDQLYKTEDDMLLNDDQEIIGQLELPENIEFEEDELEFEEFGSTGAAWNSANK